MCGVDPAIRFTYEIDFEKNFVNFLDVMIMIDQEGFFHTDLYTKPNTLNQLLSPKSAHPGFVTRSSVYSLALRLRRICCTDQLFEKRALELQEKLLERGYSREVVMAGIQRAREVVRSEALRRVEKRRVEGEEGGRQHRLITEFDRRSSPALRQVLQNNYEAACNRDSGFKAMFPKCPKPVFKRGTNLKQLLCRAKLPKKRGVNTRAGDRENTRGVSRCNKGRGRKQCGCCPYLTQRPSQVVKEVKVHSSGEVLKIEDRINCQTKSFLYLLQSDKNPLQYAGQSGGTVARRAQQHANDIERDRLEKAVPKHFADTNSGKENLTMTPFKVIKSRDPWVRLHFERFHQQARAH
jgi:ribosome modulation factor